MSWVQPDFEDCFASDVVTSAKKSEGRRWTTPKKSERKWGTPKKAISSNRGTSSPRHKPLNTSKLWIETCQPESKAELAVHKKKVEEVEQWMDSAFNGNGKTKCLLLTGPAGCGKTATVLTLAKEMGAHIQEWINPVDLIRCDSWGTSSQEERRTRTDYMKFYESQASAFSDFLFRASCYPSLDSSRKEEVSKTLILVEDFPNVFTTSPGSLGTIIKRYIQIGTNPIVFIVTDSLDKDFNSKKLFPKQLMAEMRIDTIQFNPIAQTLMVKALEKVMRCQGPNFKGPSRPVLLAMADNSSGDLRSAINALQFGCCKDVGRLCESFQGARTVTSEKKRRRTSNKPASDTTPPAIGGKDTPLFFFHALGKVLHCKREEFSRSSETLPINLKKHERLPLQTIPEEVFEQSHINADSFQLFLHQNYVPFMPSVEEIAAAAETFSDADFIMGHWESKKTLEDCAASVSLRGVMHANDGTKKVGWMALQKPQMFEVQKLVKERLEQGKALYMKPGWSSEDLFTQLIPYLKFFKSNVQGNQRFAAEVGCINTNHFKNALGEKMSASDMDQDEEQMGRNIIHAQLGQINYSDNLQEVNLSDEEEYEIEEYID